jgi:hypothetical protein
LRKKLGFCATWITLKVLITVSVLYLSQQGYLLKFQVALALVFLGHEEQGVMLMGGSGKKISFLFFEL